MEGRYGDLGVIEQEVIEEEDPEERWQVKHAPTPPACPVLAEQISTFAFPFYNICYLFKLVCSYSFSA